MCDDTTTNASMAMTFNPNVRAQRLVGAAQVLLKAMKSKDGMNSLIPIQLQVPRADSAVRTQPHTLIELVDAMAMLIRMGFVPAEPNVVSAIQDGDGHPLNHGRPKGHAKLNGECRRVRSNTRPPRLRPQVIRMACVANATMN
jgi:hypothetical protein